MKPEIEAKFLRVDVDAMRGRLKRAGAKIEIPMRLMRRVIINTPQMSEESGYLRVRDEGNKVTVTYKQFSSNTVDGAKEIEVTVSSFDDTIALLAAAGLEQTSYQESRRETWRLANAEVVIDEWPWLDPYIEIEGKSQHELEDAVKLLGLAWSDAVFGDVTVAYRAQYPHLKQTDNIGEVSEITFTQPLPDFLKP